MPFGIAFSGILAKNIEYGNTPWTGKDGKIINRPYAKFTVLAEGNYLSCFASKSELLMWLVGSGLAEGSAVVVRGLLTIKKYRNNKGVWATSLSVTCNEVVKGVDWKVELVKPSHDGSTLSASTDDVVTVLQDRGLIHDGLFRATLLIDLNTIFQANRWPVEHINKVADIIMTAFPANTRSHLSAANENRFLSLMRTGEISENFTHSMARSLWGNLIGVYAADMTPSSSTTTNNNDTMED
ncbi:unnamed protein product [Cunninghamella blakesleeana]